MPENVLKNLQGLQETRLKKYLSLKGLAKKYR